MEVKHARRACAGGCRATGTLHPRLPGRWFKYTDGHRRAGPGGTEGTRNDVRGLTDQREGRPHDSTVGRVQLNRDRPQPEASEVHGEDEECVQSRRGETGSGRTILRRGDRADGPNGIESASPG